MAPPPFRRECYPSHTCWTPQTISILLSLLSASSFCRFWRRRGRGTLKLHMRYNTSESTILSCRNLSTASAVGRWEKRNHPVKDLAQSWGSQGISRKECVAEECGHWCCYTAGPGPGGTAHRSSASFGTASSLSFKWTTVHSCRYITLTHSLPWECVYRGYQGASIALVLLLKQY